MSNNLFNILVFLFIMVASGIYTLYFISKADIIKYHKEKGIKAIIPIVGEYTLFKNAFGKSNALLTYLLTNVLPIATYLTFCTVIKNITIFWLIITLPMLISIYLRYRRNTVLFNKCYGFGKVSSILSLIFPKATFIFVYLFGKNSFHGPKTPMNKSKAKKIRTIASILLLTVSLNSLFGVTSNAEPLQEEGTQVTEEVIDDEEIIEEPVEEEVTNEENIDDSYDTWYTDENGHVHYHGKDLTITPDEELTEEELYYKFHFDYVQQEASPETIAKIKAKRQWLIDNGINNRATTNKFLYLYIGMVDNTTVLTVNDTLEYLDDKYCQGVDAHNLYIYYTRENGKLIRHNGCFNCLLGFEDVVDKPLDGEEHLIPLNENKSSVKPSEKTETTDKETVKPNKNKQKYDIKQKDNIEKESFYEPISNEVLKERPGMKEEFEERRELLEPNMKIYHSLNNITDAITSPVGGIVSNIAKDLVGLLTKASGIDKLFNFIDCTALAIDIMLSFMDYYVGNITSGKMIKQLVANCGAFATKILYDIPLIYAVPYEIKKGISDTVTNYIGKFFNNWLKNLTEDSIELEIENLFNLIKE